MYPFHGAEHHSISVSLNGPGMKSTLPAFKKPFPGSITCKWLIKELFSLHNHKSNDNKSHACVLDGCAHRQKKTRRKSPIGGVPLSYADRLHPSHGLGQFLGLHGIISAAISLLTFKVQFVILFLRCQNEMLAYILLNVKELPPKDPQKLSVRRINSYVTTNERMSYRIQWFQQHI